MADSEPLVCASLHLPLDLQPFLRINQVCSEIFLPNIDRLRLTLETTLDVCPEATQIFYQTRKTLRRELITLFGILHPCLSIAEQYLGLLGVVSEKEPTQDILSSIYRSTSVGMGSLKQAEAAMARFRGELEGAVGRVSTVMSAKYKKGSKASLSSPENTQLVFEIIGGVDECNALLQQCHDLFADLRKRTQDENSIDSNPPSEEEIQVIRAKWQTWLDNVRGLYDHGFKVAEEIELPPLETEGTPTESKTGQNVPLWRSFFQRQEKGNAVQPTNVSKLLGASPDTSTTVVIPSTSSNEPRTNENQANVVDATMPSSNAEGPEATPSNGPPSNSKNSFWRKFFRQSKKSAPSKDVSGRSQARGGEPNISFWKKFTRWATCLSTKPINS